MQLCLKSIKLIEIQDVYLLTLQKYRMFYVPLVECHEKSNGRHGMSCKKRLNIEVSVGTREDNRKKAALKSYKNFIILKKRS